MAALPIIVSVGGVLIRTTAKQLPKLLRRFKNSKEVKNPTESEIMQAGRLTKNYTNFSKKSQKILGKADTANPSFLQRITGRGRTPTQKDMKPDPALTTGEAKRAATINKALGAIGATAVVGGTGVVAVQKLKDRLAKAKVDLKKAKTEEMKATERANIESLLRQLQKAENKKTSSMSKVKPEPRPPRGNSKGGMIDYRKTGLFR
jgi:hypothetical protein